LYVGLQVESAASNLAQYVPLCAVVDIIDADAPAPVHALKVLSSNPSLNIGAAGSLYVIEVVPDVVDVVAVEVADVVVVRLELVAVVGASCTVVQP
jgi:hypothetical protein